MTFHPEGDKFSYGDFSLHLSKTHQWVYYLQHTTEETKGTCQQYPWRQIYLPEKLTVRTWKLMVDSDDMSF